MDEGRRLTDIELEKLEKALSREYRTAKKEMQKKLDKFQKKFAKSDKSQKGHLEKGDITEEQYINWKKGQLLRSSWMKDMINSYVDDQTNVNKKATSLINDVLPEVYAENHNFGTYQVEHEAKIGTSYTLFNKDTVVRLLKDDPKLLPTAKLDIPKDKRWNKQMMNSALVQGIMQGESADGIAKRLMSVTGMNESSAIRAARTMITGAEAAGKLDSYRRMKAMGIPVLKMWQATLDDKTRSSHRHLDRETADVDAPFSNGLMYPGDPDGIGVEVYNCRCNLSMQIKGFERDQSPENRMSKLGDMSYEEWKNYTKDRSGTISNEELLKKVKKLTVKYGEVDNLIPLAPEKIIQESARRYNQAKEVSDKLSDYKAEEIDVKKLETRQTWLDYEKLEDMANYDKLDELLSIDAMEKIRAIRYKGHIILIDGNHRVNLMKLKGYKKIRLLIRNV